MNDFVACLHNDVVAIICKFLQPPDIITLYKMYPKILPKIRCMFNRRVGEEIDGFFRHTFKEKYSEFRKEMINSNAALSGSLILQACLGKRWAGHGFNRLDVDLFVRVNPIYQEYDRVENQGRKERKYTFYNNKYKFKLGYTSLHHFLYKSKDSKNRMNQYVTHSQYMDEMGENVILRVNNYVMNRECIFQVVEINQEKHKDFSAFINQTVDFDICKNLFIYTNEGFGIVLGDLEAILNTQAKFNYTGSLTKSLDRCAKYMDRGFSFVAADNLDNSALASFRNLKKDCNGNRK